MKKHTTKNQDNVLFPLWPLNIYLASWPSYFIPPPPANHQGPQSTFSVPILSSAVATSCLWLLSTELWLVQIEMHCKRKIHTGFQRCGTRERM